VSAGSGPCGTCGRRVCLTPAGRLPPHWNLGCAPCIGRGEPPWSPPAGPGIAPVVTAAAAAAGITEDEAWQAREQVALDRLASAGEILAGLPAAGLVAAGVTR
jgi:hypothetical protein